MRSNGYRDAAHAIAELIDNSIQAGEEIPGTTHVEVISIDKTTKLDNRSVKRISQVAVYDDACGMPPDILRQALQFGVGTHLKEEAQNGMGKFGMGLPNASISQCRKVQVWSWQNSQVYLTYLDIDEIERGEMLEVPAPIPGELPDFWKKLIKSPLKPHGTLVVWDNLDRMTWKKSSTFLNNSELLIGRIYRYFITDKKAEIRLAAFEDKGGMFGLDNNFEKNVRPNDPLYLMQGTSAPAPYDVSPAFDELGSGETITVPFRGQNHEVRIRYAITKPQARDDGGSSAIGKHAKANQGVSVVRARRELELNRTFEISYDPRERWWGVEVSFEPGLDEVFGVSNNKQAANAFRYLDIDEDAEIEGMSPEEFRQMLQDNDDPRSLIYTLSTRIKSTLSTIRQQIQRQKEASKTLDKKTPGRLSAEGIASEVTRKRKERLGDMGKSDADEVLPQEEKISVLREVFADEEAGVTEEAATEIAIGYVESNLKFIFQERALSGTSLIFDLTSKAGTMIISINTRHPAYKNLFEQLILDNQGESESHALTALKLLLTAWARMEDEAPDSMRDTYEDIRTEWGKMARDFMRRQDD